MRRFFAGFALACSGVLGVLVPVALTAPAQADVLITVNKSAQRMSVLVDGRERYRWPVSTGRDGGPPSGNYRPQRLERTWYSRRYDWSPMPHAIFFHKGYAIHGTYYVSRLGQPASHGCVRLHPAHAAALFALVRGEGMGRTSIVVSHSAYFAER
jgi:lipoprotein-anchoring transpeptidase ErfK/SrfK